jgi:hypothetical protein
METLGFIFGIMGMSMGITGFVFALVTMAKVNKLEKQLKDLGSTLT